MPTVKTKTVNLDAEAYNRLKKVMLPKETFSSAIKRLVPPPFDMKAMFKKIDKNPISDEFADAVLGYREERRRQTTLRKRKAS